MLGINSRPKKDLGRRTIIAPNEDELRAFVQEVECSRYVRIRHICAYKSIRKGNKIDKRDILYLNISNEKQSIIKSA
jgi:hypothetical protein